MSDEKTPKRGAFWFSRFRNKPKPEEPKEELKAGYVPIPSLAGEPVEPLIRVHLICSQCGQSWQEYPCGPTHALIKHRINTGTATVVDKNKPAPDGEEGLADPGFAVYYGIDETFGSTSVHPDTDERHCCCAWELGLFESEVLRKKGEAQDEKKIECPRHGTVTLKVDTRRATGGNDPFWMMGARP